MGLAVVHGIVHAVGGHILVDSTPGVSTTFRILLPAIDMPSEAAPLLPGQEFAERVSLAGLRNMVVDDELAMASMLTELLTLLGGSCRQ